MLVIDRIELAALDEPEQMRTLDGDDPVFSRQVARPPTKSLRYGVCAMTLLATMRCAVPCSVTMVLAVGSPMHSLIVGKPFARAASATLRAGSIPSTGTRHFEHAAIRVQRKRRDGLIYVPHGVSDKGTRKGREIGVFRKNISGGHELVELSQKAALAHTHTCSGYKKRRRLQGLVGQQRIAERRGSEIDQRVVQRGVTVPYSGSLAPIIIRGRKRVQSTNLVPKQSRGLQPVGRRSQRRQVEPGKIANIQQGVIAIGVREHP